MKDLKKLFLVFFLTFYSLQAQTSFEQDYYASNLNSFNFFNKDLASLTPLPNQWSDQQIHFRWNGHMYYGNHFNAQISLRNRLFTGYQWQENLFGYREALDINRLDITSISKDNMGLHHQIDRLYAQWEKENWNVRIGRQRINWGIQNYWNSHDLFNQINFFNFDYIENPGADAVRVQYYTKRYHSVEIALNEDIQAGLYKFNLSDYDFQILLAKYFDEYSLGLGWAGQIKDAGFKGEFSYFNSTKSEENSLVGSISLDYSFKNGIYITGGCLYKNQAEYINPLDFYEMEISAKNPMPFKYSFLYQINYPIHPLVKIGTSLIHDGDLNFIFINPQITYSVSQSIDLMISSQNMWMKISEELEDINQIVFTRLQWNF